jgi:hypothetical protein
MTVLTSRQRKAFLLMIFSCAGAALLLLTWDLRPFPLWADVDDYRYVLSADYVQAVPGKLIRGFTPLDWLGPYDPTTLFKRPGFSIVLAALSALHLPFFQTVLLFHLFGLAILSNSLLRLNYPRTVVGAMFVVCGLIPTLYDSNAVRVIREVTAAGLEVAIFGLCLALFSVKVKRPLELLRNSAFLALFVLLGLHWSLREESALLLAGVLLLVNGACWLSGSPGTRGRLITAGIVSLVLMIPSQLAYFTFAALNKASYGVLMVHEISEGSFPRAVSALKRVDESPCDHTLLSPNEVQKVMAVSPSFRLVGERLGTTLKVQPDLLYGEAFYVMRLAPLGGSDIGASPLLTQDLFSRIAAEVEIACRDGRLRCADRVSGGIVPILCSSQWPLVTANFISYLGSNIARMSHSGISPWWSGMPGVNRVPPTDLALFEKITRQKMAGRKGERVEYSQPAGLATLERQDRWRQQVASTYLSVMPWLMAVGVLSLLLRLPYWRDKSRPWWLIILAAMVVHVVGRALAFSYLSAVEGYLNTRFMSTSYPIAAAFAVLSAAELGHFFSRNRAPSSQAAAVHDKAGWEKIGQRAATALTILVTLGFIYAGARPGRETAANSSASSGLDLFSEGEDEFFDYNGRRVQIVEQRQGWLSVGAGVSQGESVTFDGWGMDVATGRPTDAIVVFANGRLIATVVPTIPIPSLEQGFPAETHAGFSITLPRSAITGTKVRIFALLSGDRAGELNYPSSYLYRD